MTAKINPRPPQMTFLFVEFVDTKNPKMILTWMTIIYLNDLYFLIIYRSNMSKWIEMSSQQMEVV